MVATSGRTNATALLALALMGTAGCAPSEEEAPWPSQGIAWTEGGTAQVWWNGRTAELPDVHWIYGWLPQQPRLLFSMPDGIGVFDADLGETVAEFACSCNAVVGTDPEFPVVVHEHDHDDFIWLDAGMEPIAQIAAADVLPVYGPDSGIYLGDLHGRTLYFGYAEFFNERVLADSIFGLTSDGELTPVLPDAQEFPQGRMNLYVSPDGGTIAYVQRQDRSTCERWARITLLDATGTGEPREIALPASLRDLSTEIGQVHWEGDELHFTARQSGFFGHLVMPCEDSTEPLILSALYGAATDESVLLSEGVLMRQSLEGGSWMRLTAPGPGEEGPLLQVRRGDRWVTLAERPGDVHVQPVSL